MKARALNLVGFGALLDGLIFTLARNGKLRLLADFYRRARDPDRGYALAAITVGLYFPSASPRSSARR